jgi:conjugative relaxase-like TrwC/TraI family protein
MAWTRDIPTSSPLKQPEPTAVLSVAALTGGPGYYLELANINYYLEGGEPLPLWYGTAARELGLSGVAEREHVERLCAGFHHETGKGLVQNAGKETRNPGQDLTFSAPKSVSVAWAMADSDLRKAIEEKQLAAVRQALDYLETKAGFARVGKQGQGLVKAPLLFCLFEHGTSRAQDPQLHTHALCINLTMLLGGRIRAVDTTHLYHLKMAAGAIYRAALAQGMQELGFAIEQRKVGASVGFELSAIPKALIEHFSKRRAELEGQMMLRAGSLDAASPKYAELLAKETRRTKDTEKPRQELLREWQEVGREHGVDAAYLQAQRIPFTKLSPEQRAERKEQIFKEALSALSEQQAHWNEAEFTKAVAERAAGRLPARDVRELIENKLRSPEHLYVGSLQTKEKNEGQKRYINRIEERYSTPEARRMERRMIQDAERIVRGPRSESQKAVVEEVIKRRETLDKEQAEAVRWLTGGPGIRLLSGLPGTGKTFALSTCHEVWTREGRAVVGCAVAAAAAKRLQAGTGIQSGTLDSLLYKLDNGYTRLHDHSVIVLDEAGMVPTKQMARLIEHVSHAPGARLCLIGDAKQLQPVLAGGPFKYLAQALGEAVLTTIRRQEEKWARDAVKSYERGEIGKAIAAYIEHGRFHLADSRPQAMAKLIDQWKEDGGIKDPSKVFMLAGLNAEVKDLNLRAQAERIRAGEVSPERKLYANGVFFHEGDRLQFQKNSKELQVSNSDTATVLKVEPERQRLTVKLDLDGRELVVDLKRYSGNNLRLGYASTTHKAQGASIPHVHVLMGGQLTDFHMGYVQLSRSQKTSHLFCDKHTAGGPELADLIRSLGRERQKTMAQEIVDQERRRLELQPVRGISLGM